MPPHHHETSNRTSAKPCTTINQVDGPPSARYAKDGYKAQLAQQPKYSLLERYLQQTRDEDVWNGFHLINAGAEEKL